MPQHFVSFYDIFAGICVNLSDVQIVRSNLIIRYCWPIGSTEASSIANFHAKTVDRLQVRVGYEQSCDKSITLIKGWRHNKILSQCCQISRHHLKKN